MYIDPNTGGQLFQILAVLFGIFSTLVLIFSSRIRMFFGKLNRMRHEKTEDMGELEQSEESKSIE